MNQKKEMEDWVRKTLTPPRKAAKPENEVQFEVDRLLEERLAEFKPERARPQNTPRPFPVRTSPDTEPPKTADPPHPDIFTNYAARSRPDKKWRVLVTTGLVFGIVAGAVAVIIKSAPGTDRSLQTRMTTASHEIQSSSADTPQTGEHPSPESEPPPGNPTKIAAPDAEDLSSEASVPSAVPPPIEDEFLLEIDMPPPTLAKSSLEDPQFPVGQGDFPENFPVIMNKEESVQSQDAPSPPEPRFSGSDDPVASVDGEPAGATVALEAVDTPPVVRGRVQPDYPVEAYRRGIEGTVVINVLISESGGVLQTKVLRTIKGPFGFDAACTEALRQWRFDPAVKDGKRVQVWKPISITFKIK